MKIQSCSTTLKKMGNVPTHLKNTMKTSPTIVWNSLGTMSAFESVGGTPNHSEAPQTPVNLSCHQPQPNGFVASWAFSLSFSPSLPLVLFCDYIFLCLFKTPKSRNKNEIIMEVFYVWLFGKCHILKWRRNCVENRVLNNSMSR